MFAVVRPIKNVVLLVMAKKHNILANILWRFKDFKNFVFVWHKTRVKFKYEIKKSMQLWVFS